MNTRIDYYLNSDGTYSLEKSEQRREELKKLREINYPVLFNHAVRFLVSQMPHFKIGFKNLRRNFMYDINKATYRGGKPIDSRKYICTNFDERESTPLSFIYESAGSGYSACSVVANRNQLYFKL